MYVTYFDEVKCEPKVQPDYWLCGFALTMADVPILEAAVDKLADECFGLHTLTAATEFHAQHIFNGRGNFKGWDVDKRLDLLKKLVLLLHAPGHIFKFYVRVIPENILYSSKKPHAIAYMYLLEQVDSFLREKGAYGMMFADRDDEQVSKSVESLSLYKANSTEWAQGRKLENIVDTIHFARSHHSRLIQLADIFVYAAQFLNSAWTDKRPKSRPRQIFGDFLRTESHLLENCRYKVWPQQAMWFR